jgi:hypothetical protein
MCAYIRYKLVFDIQVLVHKQYKHVDRCVIDDTHLGSCSIMLQLLCDGCLIQINTTPSAHQGYVRTSGLSETNRIKAAACRTLPTSSDCLLPLGHSCESIPIENASGGLLTHCPKKAQIHTGII